MTAISDFVTFTIQVNSSGVSLPGFGTPLVVSYGAAFSGVRVYSSYAGVLGDFAAGTPEADAANALFNQSPKPQQIMIGAGTLKPTLQYTVGVQTVVNSQAYQVQVDGPGITSTLASYTSGSSVFGTVDPIPAIHNGMITALNAVAGKNYTAAFSPLASLTGQTFTVLSQGSGTLTINNHGLHTGDGPVQLTTTGSLPTGYSTLTNYWVINISTNVIALATSLANALAGTAVTLSSNGSGTNTETPQSGALSPFLPFQVNGSAAGNWFSIDVLPNNTTTAPGLLSNSMTHVDPGIATDLASLLLANPGWYWLVTNYNSKAMSLAAAAWCESNTKAYIVSVVDTAALTTSAGNGDTLDALNTLGYNHTSGWYHNSPLECFGAALTGTLAPQNPGKWTAAYKTLVGVVALTLTETQVTNLRARNAGTYSQVLGASVTWDGKVAGGTYKWLDITVGIDWFTSQVTGAAFGAMISVPKVGYTDDQIDIIASAVRGVLTLATSDAYPILNPGNPVTLAPAPPSITFPQVATIASATRALRQLPNGVITGTFVSAVQSIQFQATLSF